MRENRNKTLFTKRKEGAIIKERRRGGSLMRDFANVDVAPVDDATAECNCIRQDTFVETGTYPENISFADLYSHRGIEISMIVGGAGIHRVMEQAIPCKVGDIYILNTNIPHRYYTAEEGTSLVVRRILFHPTEWLNGSYGDPSKGEYCYGVFAENATASYAVLTRQAFDKITSLCDLLTVELLEKKGEWRMAVRAYLSLIMIFFTRYVNRAIKNVPSETTPTEWNQISFVTRAIAERYGDENLTLGKLSEALFISKSQLSRLFQRLTGEPFKDYLKKVRLNIACQLLRDTDMKVDEIMQQCGLRDATSFYKAFSLHTGYTPIQYRKTHQKGENTMSILNEISENLQIGKAKIVKELVNQALQAGISAQTILTEGLLSGMNVIGEKFKNNQVYVPEVLVAARAMNAGATILKPYLTEEGVGAKGKVCIGTVQGDLHDIGKNLVKMMMEGKGLEVIDLGTDVSPQTFIQTAIDEDCQVICLSALLTTTMSVMADVVRAAEEAGIRDKVKIMVGGAPITDEFCREIGADVYTVDAASAADAAVALCKV